MGLTKKDLALLRESAESGSYPWGRPGAGLILLDLLALLESDDQRLNRAMALLFRARAEADDCVKWGHSKLHAGDLCDEINTFLASLDATDSSEHQRLIASVKGDPGDRPIDRG